MQSLFDKYNIMRFNIEMTEYNKEPTNLGLTGTTDLLFGCPHCGGLIEVKRNEINCKIFIHGTNKKGQQVGQHISTTEAIKQMDGANTGCGLQFELIEDKLHGCYKPTKCENK